MKKLAILLFFAAIMGSVSAQQVFRSQFSLYDTRDDSVKRDHSKTVNHMPYVPQFLGDAADGLKLYSMAVDVPASWNDYNAYLHIENTHMPYDVAVNSSIVYHSDDPDTPRDFFISPYLNQGSNQVVIVLHSAESSPLNKGVTPSKSKQFDGCYLFAQHRASVYDYDAAIVEREGKLHLELDIIAGNDFNFEETINIGYDIYTPEKKLVDYAVREMTIAGRSRDTLKVRIDLGAETRYLWSATKPQLYRTTLYIKRNGKPFEYLPLPIGAGRTTFEDGKIYRNGKVVTIKDIAYCAATTAAESRKQISAIKAKGYNTLRISNPQSLWFYDLCDELGVYVIEQASINPTNGSDNRAIGGTPSNDPKYVDSYLERVKSMYYRTRNHSCIIAYSLGGDKAGNGYCMYKAYQWLKSVETLRPVICRTADGEWDTDM